MDRKNILSPILLFFILSSVCFGQGKLPNSLVLDGWSITPYQIWKDGSFLKIDFAVRKLPGASESFLATRVSFRTIVTDDHGNEYNINFYPYYNIWDPRLNLVQRAPIGFTWRLLGYVNDVSDVPSGAFEKIILGTKKIYKIYDLKQMKFPSFEIRKWLDNMPNAQYLTIGESIDVGDYIYITTLKAGQVEIDGRYYYQIHFLISNKDYQPASGSLFVLGQLEEGTMTEGRLSFDSSVSENISEEGIRLELDPSQSTDAYAYFDLGFVNPLRFLVAFNKFYAPPKKVKILKAYMN